MPESWKQTPECFGKGCEDVKECGVCDDRIECLQIQSVENQKKFIKDGKEVEVALTPQQLSRMRSGIDLDVWYYKISHVIEDKTLKLMLDKLMAQGFSRDEALALVLALIKF